MVDRWINFYYLEQINQVYISHFIYFNLGEKKKPENPDDLSN